MLQKRIIPQAQDFGGQQPVEILKISSKGLDKTASMQKRAAAFQWVIKDLKPMPKKAYLHVITTGAYETYSANRNCFIAGTNVVTDKGTVKIQQLKQGDRVLTAQGVFKPVVATMQRPYTGDLYKIKATGVAQPVICTQDHPILALNAKRMQHFYYRLKTGRNTQEQYNNMVDQLVQERTFIPAHALKGDQYVVLPTQQDTAFVSRHDAQQVLSARCKALDLDEDSQLFAYVLGFWLAQGCLVLNRKPYGDKFTTKSTVKSGSIVFCVNTTQDKYSVEKLKLFAQTFGFNVAWSKTNSSKFTNLLTLSGIRLALRFKQLLGSGAKNKSLNPCIFAKSDAWKKSFIAGYLDGDGCVSVQGKQIVSITMSTVSISLVNDIQRLLATLGIRSSSSKGMNRHSNGCFGKTDNVIYAVRISAPNAQHLLPYTQRLRRKTLNIPVKPYQLNKSILTDKNTVVRLAKVQKIKVNNPILVYDIQVQDSHTFCVPFVVHNCDGYNQGPFVLRPPMPKNASCKQVQIGQGLKTRHSTYLQDAGVYQQHETDKEKSGVVKAAKYNEPMHRGQLLIEVDTDKWAARLSKKASGQDIFLSIGCSLPADCCSACGHRAHTLDQHCEHIKKHAGAVLEDGTRICMINDNPKFYDISGVNTPADQMAFVLRKIASGTNSQDALYAARVQPTRRPMSLSKAAGILSKLAQMQKQLQCKAQDDPIFKDEPQAISDFLSAVENYDADQVIDHCNRKAILLSPQMLFKLLGKGSDQEQAFNTVAQSCPCCGQHLMQDMEQDPEFSAKLGDGSFDSALPVDLNLQEILKSFIPEFGVSRPAINGKAIRIVIGGEPQKDMDDFQDKLKDQQSDDQEEKDEDEDKEDVKKKAAAIGQQYRRTYARYVISFAQRNSQDTCRLALQKIARYK